MDIYIYIYYVADMSSIFNGGLPCRGVIICEIIVHLLVIIQNNKNIRSIVEIVAYRNIFQGRFIAFSVITSEREHVVI